MANQEDDLEKMMKQYEELYYKKQGQSDDDANSSIKNILDIKENPEDFKKQYESNKNQKKQKKQKKEEIDAEKLQNSDSKLNFSASKDQDLEGGDESGDINMSVSNSTANHGEEIKDYLKKKVDIFQNSFQRMFQSAVTPKKSHKQKSNVSSPLRSEQIQLITEEKEQIMQIEDIQPKKIIIIGATIAGIQCARVLSKKNPDYEITIIDKKQYFENSQKFIEYLEDPEIFEDESFEFQEIFEGNETINFFQAKVIDLKENHLVCKRKQRQTDKEELMKLEFDYCVIATGKNQVKVEGLPNKRDAKLQKELQRRATQLNIIADSINSKNELIVVGSDHIACQIALELKTRFEEKEVTIITEDDQLLLQYGFKKNVLKYKNEIAVKFNTKKADYIKDKDNFLVFDCTKQYNIKILISQFEFCTTLDNHIIVNDYLQLNNENRRVHRNIYSIGTATYLIKDNPLQQIGAFQQHFLANICSHNIHTIIEYEESLKNKKINWNDKQTVKIIENKLEKVGRGAAPFFMLNFGKGYCLRVYRILASHFKIDEMARQSHNKFQLGKLKGNGLLSFIYDYKYFDVSFQDSLLNLFLKSLFFIDFNRFIKKPTKYI